MLNRSPLFNGQNNAPSELRNVITIAQESGAFDTESIFSLRKANSTFIYAFQNAHNVPYMTKIDFMLGVSGHFFSKEAFEFAWWMYRSTVRSPSHKAAVLYRLKDADKMLKDDVFIDFKDSEPLDVNGRRYAPGQFHNLTLNYVWLMAQFHHKPKARDFYIYSDINAENFSPTNQTVTSAFGHEVTIAYVKAGYKFDITTGYGYLRSPVVSGRESAKKIHMFRFNDLIISAKDVQKTLLDLGDQDYDRMLAQKLMKQIVDFKTKMFDYPDFKTAMIAMLPVRMSNILEEALKNSKSKQRMINIFLTLYNDPLYLMNIELVWDDGLSFDSNIQAIRNTISQDIKALIAINEVEKALEDSPETVRKVENNAGENSKKMKRNRSNENVINELSSSPKKATGIGAALLLTSSKDILFKIVSQKDDDTKNDNCNNADNSTNPNKKNQDML